MIAPTNLIAFAAIRDGETVATITTELNVEAAMIHDRMPVMLEEEALVRFLDPELLTERDRDKILAPSMEDTLNAWPVSKLVGNVRNNDPGLIEAVQLDGPLPKRPKG